MHSFGYKELVNVMGISFWSLQIETLQVKYCHSKTQGLGTLNNN